MTSNESAVQAQIHNEDRPHDFSSQLGERVVAAARAAFDIELADPLIRPSAGGRGADYQCNVAMSLAKQLGKPPREVAQQLLDHLDAADLCEPPTLGGPGFINFTVRPDWLGRHIAALAVDSRLGVPAAADLHRVVIDLSGPNVAKEMHVGHLRSTIIGNALARILRYVGHEVIPQNHLGDWGTPFGMLLEYTRQLGWDGEQAGGEHSISDLNAFYQQARAQFDSDPDFADRARRRVVALQGGDEDSLRLWHQFIAESQRHFSQVYDLLGIDLTQEDARGESFYNPVLADTVAELERLGVARLSDGALCVFPEGFVNADGDPMPLIVRKSDGGYNYASTDLAAVRYRVGKLAVDRSIYVVGSEQALHFQMVFAVAREAGWIPPGVSFEHAQIGMVLGEDGNRLKTREGETPKLDDLIAEGVDRARGILDELDAGSRFDVAELDAVAEAVGVGAVKYADLSTARDSGYVFDFDRMISFRGNTGPYLQYATARIKSIFRRGAQAGGVDVAAGPGDLAGGADAEAAAHRTDIAISAAPERALALRLLSFGAMVTQLGESAEPHRLCAYLFEVASLFTTFYEECPVLKAESESLRATRLALCALTQDVLSRGLGLLGVPVLERM
jgi:arginyl-tRNA synthetase